MSIKFQHPLATLDSKRLAALLTPQLLRPVLDDAPAANQPAAKVGQNWLLWGELTRDSSQDGN